MCYNPVASRRRVTIKSLVAVVSFAAVLLLASAWGDGRAIGASAAPAQAQDATGQIAFTSDRDGNNEVYVMNADGSKVTRLTSNPASDGHFGLAWSPDGSRITFNSFRDGNNEVYVMNADGSSLSNLTNDPADDGTPACAPDGSRIAFDSNREGINDVFVIIADGSGLTRLTDDPGINFAPAWSPDGTRIAFYSDRDGNNEVYIMNADGSGQTNLTNSPAFDRDPAWSPDGNRVAFYSDRDGNNEVYVMNADGSGLARLTDHPASDFDPAWSPDGSRIAFASDRDGNSEIYVMDSDGSGQTRLTDNPAADSGPAWSPALVEPGPPQTEFVESVPDPDDISTDPDVVGSNMTLTLFVIFSFAFTSVIFNQTLASNREEIEGWVGRFFAPFRRLSRIAEQRYDAVAERRPWVQRVVGPAVILVLTGLFYGFLSPDFGFNTKSIVLFLSLVVGVGAITYVFAGGEALFTRRRFGLRAGVKLYAVALAIAVGSVLVSRLVDFQPGFIVGFVASYTLLAPAALDRKQDGQAAFFPAIALLALSLIAWVLLIPLREVTQESDNSWVGLPEGMAVAVFVAGLQGSLFSMIPLSFMHGARIAQWNRLLWLLMFGVAGFLFWHVFLNPEGAYLEAVEQGRVIAALALLSFYSVVTLVAWVYFRERVYGWPMPAMPWSRRPRS